jgi:hypothetical protein
MTSTVTKIDESWNRLSGDHVDSPEEHRRYLIGEAGTYNEGELHYEKAKAWIQKYQEYEKTHQYVSNQMLYFQVENTPYSCPLKFKKNGEMIKWPGYDSDPEGLYEVPTKAGGYVYEVKTGYVNTLWTIAHSTYKSPATYVRAYEKHHK